MRKQTQQSLRAYGTSQESSYRVISRQELIEDALNPHFTPEDHIQASISLRPQLPQSFSELSGDEKQLVKCGLLHWLQKATNPFNQKDRTVDIEQALEVCSLFSALQHPDDKEQIWDDSFEAEVASIIQACEQKQSSTFSRQEDITDAAISRQFAEEFQFQFRPTE